ncbi:MAG: glycerophosphodiester phosphodiesterase family protein [Mycobacteriaceae bacterium]
MPSWPSPSRRAVRGLSAAVLGIAVATAAAPVAAADPSSDLPGSAPGSVLPSVPGSLPGSLPGSSLPGSDASDNLPSTFDLQAHRGGRGEYTEESAVAFEKALDLGVTTLELDIHITRDGVPAVWHDPSIQDDKCTDTAPATEGDPQFPYVGKDVHDLDWEQIQTLNCDLTLADYPDAQPVEGNKIIDLPEVFDIAERDPEVHFNIETKIEAEEPERSAPPQQYVDTILDAADAAGATDRVAVQSFDWSSLPLVRERAPQVPIVALWDDTTWVEGSPYLGPVDFNAVGGDPIQAGKELGVEVLSPAFDTSSPWYGGDLPGWIAAAQDEGFRVVPWTANETADLEEWIDAGTDGIITDYPTRLKEILDARGIAYRA